MKIIAIVIASLLALTGGIYLIETNTREEFLADATVVDRFYTPSRTVSGGGIGANGTYVPTISHISARHILFVTLDLRVDDKVYEFTTARANWLLLEKGDRIEVAWATSFFGSSSLWLTRLRN